jgi:hypothetical protein
MLVIHYPDSNNESRGQSVETGAYPLRVSPMDFDSINSAGKQIQGANNSGRMAFLFTEGCKTQGGSNNIHDANSAIYDYGEKCPKNQSSLAKYGGNIMGCSLKPSQPPCGGPTNQSDIRNRSVEPSKPPPHTPFLSEGNNKGQNNSGQRIGVVRKNGKGSTFSKNPTTASHYKIHDACKTTLSKSISDNTKTWLNICPHMNQDEMLQIIENSPPMRQPNLCKEKPPPLSISRRPPSREGDKYMNHPSHNEQYSDCNKQEPNFQTENLPS